jgi:hypothetical protein
VLAASLALVAVAAGCRSSDVAISPTTTTSVTKAPPRSAPVGTSPSGTTDPVGTAVPAPGGTAGLPTGDEAQIREVLKGYWVQRLAANSPPNPDYVPFVSLLTGDRLQREVLDLQKERARGEAMRLPANSQSMSRTLRVDIDGDAAVAQECDVDDAVLYRVADGSVLNQDVVTQRREVHLQRVDGSWKISEGAELDERAGVVPCDISRSLSS